MTPKIHGILLIPNDEYREALLRKGPLGARPPSYIAPFEPFADRTEGPYSDSVWRCPACLAVVGAGYTKKQAIERIIHGWWCDYRSLPLAWKGKPIPEGMDRLGRVMDTVEGHATHWLTVEWGATIEGTNIELAVSIAEAVGFGTIILIDKDGREITGGIDGQ